MPILNFFKSLRNRHLHAARARPHPPQPFRVEAFTPMLALHHEFLFVAIPSGGVEKASRDNSHPAIFKPSLLDVFVNLRNFDLFGLEVVGIVDDEAVL